MPASPRVSTLKKAVVYGIYDIFWLWKAGGGVVEIYKSTHLLSRISIILSPSLVIIAIAESIIPPLTASA